MRPQNYSMSLMVGSSPYWGQSSWEGLSSGHSCRNCRSLSSSAYLPSRYMKSARCSLLKEVVLLRSQKWRRPSPQEIILARSYSELRMFEYFLASQTSSPSPSCSAPQIASRLSRCGNCGLDCFRRLRRVRVRGCSCYPGPSRQSSSFSLRLSTWISASLPPPPALTSRQSAMRIQARATLMAGRASMPFSLSGWSKAEAWQRSTPGRLTATRFQIEQGRWESPRTARKGWRQSMRQLPSTRANLWPSLVGTGTTSTNTLRRSRSKGHSSPYFFSACHTHSVRERKSCSISSWLATTETQLPTSISSRLIRRLPFSLPAIYFLMYTFLLPFSNHTSAPAIAHCRFSASIFRPCGTMARLLSDFSSFLLNLSAQDLSISRTPLYRLSALTSAAYSASCYGEEAVTLFIILSICSLPCKLALKNYCLKVSAVSPHCWQACQLLMMKRTSVWVTVMSVERAKREKSSRRGMKGAAAPMSWKSRKELPLQVAQQHLQYYLVLSLSYSTSKRCSLPSLPRVIACFIIYNT